MLEEIVNQTGLTLGGLEHPTFDLDSMSPFIQKQSKSSNIMTGGDGRIGGVFGVVTGDRSVSKVLSSASPTGSYGSNVDLAYQTMAVDEDPETWLNELLAENVPGMDSMLPWGELA
jgi:hypothetical protein